MDAEDAKLFATALRQVTETRTRDDLDRALDELGWVDALADDRRTAVATLFELQGECDVTSSALDMVVATAAGLPDRRVVLPALGGHDAPGVVDGTRVRVRGLCRSAVTGDVCVVAATTDGWVALPVAYADLQMPTWAARCAAHSI